MAEQGIVSVVADPDAHVAVGANWVEALRTLSDRITFVRVGIGGDQQGHVDLPLLKRGLQAYADSGMEVRAVLEGSLGPPDTNPNALLASFRNPWIDGYTAACVQLLNDLGPLAPKTVWVLNEGNVQAGANQLASGRKIPQLALGMHPDHEKPEAMSPEAWGSALVYASYEIQQQCKQVTTILPGALSCQVRNATSMTDQWIGGYLNTAMRYLTDNGCKPPWPWTSICLNLEGVVSPQYAQYIAWGMARQKRSWSVVGPTIVPEWGVSNPIPPRTFNLPALTETAQALAGICGSMAFMSAHNVGGAGGYGCYQVSYRDGEIVPGDPLPWASRLGGILHTLGS